MFVIEKRVFLCVGKSEWRHLHNTKSKEEARKVLKHYKRFFGKDVEVRMRKLSLVVVEI